MNIAYRLARILCPTRPPKYHFGDFIDIARGCFATRDRAIICWEGENYVPMKTSLRVRMHNWLIRVGDRPRRGLSDR